MSEEHEGAIAIGKKFSLTHDANSWVVIKHPAKGQRTRTDAKGNVMLVGDRRYFSRLHHALHDIYDSRLAGVKSIEDLMVKTEEHYKELRAVAEEIRAAVTRAQNKVLDIPAETA